MGRTKATAEVAKLVYEGAKRGHTLRRCIRMAGLSPAVAYQWEIARRDGVASAAVVSVLDAWQKGRDEWVDEAHMAIQASGLGGQWTAYMTMLERLESGDYARKEKRETDMTVRHDRAEDMPTQDLVRVLNAALKAEAEDAGNPPESD